MRHTLKLLTLAAALNITACSTISGWFADEEELEIRKLAPIEAQFTPKEVWSKRVGDGVSHYFSRLKPAVGYDMVFAASRQGIVEAFEQSSGNSVWRKDFATYDRAGIMGTISLLWYNGKSAKLSGGLSLAYETLFFGSEDGIVYALDAKTGEVKWQVNVKGEVLAAPAIDAGVVVVNTGAGVVFGLDANSGEQLWSHESEVPALTLRGISAPTASNGGALVGTPGGKLQVNLLATGQLAWEQTIAAPTGATELDRIVDIDSQPLVLGSNIYVISFNGTLAAVEMRSGRVVWKREYAAYRNASIDGNNLYVVDNHSNVFAIDRRNGVELWSQGTLRGRHLTSAAPVGNYVVLGDNYGYLHWLNKDDGQIVARMDIGGDDEDEAIYAAPVVDGNTLYTLTRDGELVAISTP